MSEMLDSIINEICIEKGIKVKNLSYNWIKELKKGDKTHYIVGNNFDLNSAVSKMISNDKYATYEILKSNNIPIIEHNMIFNPETRSEYYNLQYLNDAKRLLEHDKKVIVKANDSSRGIDVYCCKNINELNEVTNLLFNENNNTLSLCPFIDIDYEYRIVYLNGEILFIYKKEKPYVIGNGYSTLGELIKIKSEEENKEIDIIKEIELNYIPKKDEKITISWKHNLSNGAEPILLDDSDLYINEIKSLALKTGNILGITFASIDICHTTKNEIQIMEVNGTVCMSKFIKKVSNGYEIAKKIYSKAIDKMFDL